MPEKLSTRRLLNLHIMSQHYPPEAMLPVNVCIKYLLGYCATVWAWCCALL